MTSPIATVIVDTYNQGRFIESALTSVLDQDMPPGDLEVIVVDDGSTDATAAVIKKFIPRVRYLRKENGGQASAFNTAIPEARGEVVAFLDGDDWWTRNKLRTVVEAFAREPDVGAVGHGIVEVYPERQREIVPNAGYRIHLRDLEGACRFRTIKAFLGTSRFAARRAVLHRILPVPEALVIEADEFLFTAAAAVADVLLLTQPFAYYRLHDDNLFQYQSPNPQKMRRKYCVLDELTRLLPPMLARLGVPPVAVAAVIEPIWVEAQRLRLTVDGGRPWETVRVERAAFRLACKRASFRYRLLKAAFLGLGLVLPPRRYFQLRQWYSTRSAGKLGRWLRRATPAAPVLQRWREA
jgi:glycosyltransferase involved in cell wall biosynthesis